jgi:hypothetical protein
LKGRGTGDGAEGVEQVLTLLASGGEDAGADRRGLGTPIGAEATDHPAVDHRGAQVALRADPVEVDDTPEFNDAERDPYTKPS